MVSAALAGSWSLDQRRRRNGPIWQVSFLFCNRSWLCLPLPLALMVIFAVSRLFIHWNQNSVILVSFSMAGLFYSILMLCYQGARVSLGLADMFFSSSKFLFLRTLFKISLERGFHTFQLEILFSLGKHNDMIKSKKKN